MQRTLIVNALASEAPQRQITVCGWIRTRRDAKDVSFVEINDGSCLTNMQCIVDAGTAAHEGLGDANTGASVAVTGELVASPGKGQKWEVRAESIRVFGLADPESFPLQKKRHSDEFLRGIAHLRMRTNKYGEVLDADLEPIPGLYSAGSDCNTIYGDSYNFTLPGNTMGFAINSGRMAGEAVADYING